MTMWAYHRYKKINKILILPYIAESRQLPAFCYLFPVFLSSIIPITIATIPLGYADGIFRSYSKHGKVIINNTYCKIVGNICMDMTMLDVTDVEGVEVGSVVTILGTDKNNSII